MKDASFHHREPKAIRDMRSAVAGLDALAERVPAVASYPNDRGFRTMRGHGQIACGEYGYKRK